MATSTGLDAQDLAQAADHGLGEDEISRQLALLLAPRPSILLDRPCTIGDGVRRIGEADMPELLAAQAEAAAAGRATCFIPASGAASRMFKSLLTVHGRGATTRASLAGAPGDADAAVVLGFFDRVRDFAFAGDLASALSDRGTNLTACLERGEVSPVLDTLLGEDGLALPDKPKGLLPFHRYPGESRTAFDEHLVEAFDVAATSSGATRLHFTVSAAHQSGFEARLAASRTSLETSLRARLEVGFSTQQPATDTIAVDPSGRPFRDDRGALLFRPGGHGSLVANLADLARDGADLIFVKNIDNVVHNDWRPEVVHWRRLLAGRLVVVQERLFAALRRLDRDPDETAVAQATALLREELAIDVPDTGGDLARAVATIRRHLDRPIRVCAVLRAEGDPGGGPFWVREADGSTSLQIVETAQIDQTSATQRAVQARATHFSPADMVLGVRSYRSKPFDLRRHVDASAVFIAEKSSGGRALRALEHPGLWNGGMADWNTLFVEVPPSIFHPVKALTDLLNPAHQPTAESH